jgi:cell division protein FtsI/penicillin-binding protein 2
MGAVRRSWWLAGAAAVVVAAVVAGALVLRHRSAEQDRDAAASAAADALAAAWVAGDLSKAPVADPAGAQETYTALAGGLGTPPTSVEVTSVERSGDEATADLTVTWPFGDGWSYETSATLTGDLDASAGGTWTTEVTPALVHPELADGERLVAVRTPAERADVLGRDGAPIVTESPVVDVGVQPSRTTDPAGLARSLGDILDVDAAALQQRITAASPDAFVPVITLRRPDYDAVRDRLQPLPGTVFRESTLPLAPTREFGRALLGTVGPATAELVEASDGRLVAGDVTGLSGLQRQYDARLAGTPGVTVSKVTPASGEGGEETRTELFTVEPVAGTPIQLTLDADVQKAADAALATATGGNGNAALVAVDVPSGDVLAVANTPASGANRAMTGRYPPGSTFKTISTIALLGRGVTPTETVACPPTATVDGRSVRNFEGGAFGDVPFRTDFAQSCNTAFVGLSNRLERGDLKAAAESVGLGVDWSVGADAFTGSVPVEESDVEKAAATIGQGKVLASPLAMAQAVASIARGSWSPPRLVVDPAPSGEAPQPPAADPQRLATVKDLMRQVVVDGTASALNDVPGPPVHGKTGTAEYGTESPPRTHAWTVGFQGDVAFAVLVEDGRSGGSVAVPVAEAFLRAL